MSRFAVYSRRNTELLMLGSDTASGSNSGTVICFVSTNWNMRARSIDCSLKPLLWYVSVRT